MRLFFAIIISFFTITACSAQPIQATVTRFAEVTVTLPSATLTATSTLALTATSTITPIPTFNPETWAGTDTVRLGFVQNMRDWGIIDFTCGEDGICKDKAGNQIFDAKTGIKNLEFLMDNLPPEKFEQSNYVPTNGERKSAPLNIGEYLRAVVFDHQSELDQMFPGGRSGFTGLLIHDFGGGKYAWAFVGSGKNEDGKAVSYLIYNNEKQELVKHKIDYIHYMDVANYYDNKRLQPIVEP